MKSAELFCHSPVFSFEETFADLGISSIIGTCSKPKSSFSHSDNEMNRTEQTDQKEQTTGRFVLC